MHVERERSRSAGSIFRVRSPTGDSRVLQRPADAPDPHLAYVNALEELVVRRADLVRVRLACFVGVHADRRVVAPVDEPLDSRRRFPARHVT